METKVKEKIMQFSKVEIEHLRAQMAQALEILTDHEKRLLLQEGKWSHASEMKKSGKKGDRLKAANRSFA